MNLPSLFRSYKHRRFNYIPVKYDQQKEELQERIRRVEGEMETQPGHEYESKLFRGAFRHVSGYRTKANRASTFRVIIIIAILAAFIFFLFSL